MSILATLIGMAINLVASAVTKGSMKLPDAVPLVGSLVDAMGHVTGETDAERTARRTATEQLFAKHAASLLDEPAAGGTP